MGQLTALAPPVTHRFNAQGIVLGVAVALLLVLVAYPLLWLLLGAFGLPQEFTFDGLDRAFSRTANYTALLNTLELAAGAGVMSVVLGVPLAWATARSDMPLRRSVHALVALSYMVGDVPENVEKGRAALLALSR